MKKILITGGNGNLGRLAAHRFLDNDIEVVCFDLPGTEPASTREGQVVITGDIRDNDKLETTIKNHKPDVICHLASLLSGSSELDLTASWEINATASFNLMKLAREHDVNRFFFASTAATYGAVDEDPMPEDYRQWPTGMYGATKVAVERLGYYFRTKHGLDFRCVRYPLVISPYAPPSAVSAYPSHALLAARRGESFVFPVQPDTGIGTIYLDDVVTSIAQFVLVAADQNRRPAYNLSAYYLTAEMAALTARQRFPQFEYSFEPDPVVDDTMRGWPDQIDDTAARNDWGWQPECDFEESVNRLLKLVESSEQS